MSVAILVPWCKHYFEKPWIYGSFSSVDSVNLSWPMAVLCNRHFSCCERLATSAASEASPTSFARSRYSCALLLSLNAPNTALAPDVCRRLCSLGIYDRNHACPLWKGKKRPVVQGKEKAIQSRVQTPRQDCEHHQAEISADKIYR